tara:strand:+ start:43268 stop:44464 length:1197 start_codon:yes stop_codon:yes gene_type:complete
MNSNKISVIIPSFNFADSLERVLLGVKNQTVQALEVIIVDSSPNQEVHKVVKSSNFSNISIQYLKVDRAFPGEARNIGTNQAKGEYLAFLDSKTVPKDNWLELGLEALENEKKDVVFGVTEYKSKTSFQRILQAATFGKIGHETTPGSIIKKSIYSESSYFIEGVRTADDLFWRKNLKFKNLDWKTPTEVTLTYSELPDNYWEILKRYFIYSWHTSRVNVQNNMKDLYLGIMLILSALLVPRWNTFVGWEESLLYIPNVTKVYLLVILFIFIINLVLRTAFPNENDKNSFLWFSLKSILFIAFIAATYRWNKVVAGWIEDSPLYFPHITKIYIASIFSLAVLIRGVYMPIKRKVDLKFIFPFRWLLIGLYGVGLDLSKAPGYAFGALIAPFLNKKNKS